MDGNYVWMGIVMCAWEKLCVDGNSYVWMGIVMCGYMNLKHLMQMFHCSME